MTSRHSFACRQLFPHRVDPSRFLRLRRRFPLRSSSRQLGCPRRHPDTRLRHRGVLRGAGRRGAERPVVARFLWAGACCSGPEACVRWLRLVCCVPGTLLPSGLRMAGGDGQTFCGDSGYGVRSGLLPRPAGGRESTIGLGGTAPDPVRLTNCLDVSVALDDDRAGVTEPSVTSLRRSRHNSEVLMGRPNTLVLREMKTTPPQTSSPNLLADRVYETLRTHRAGSLGAGDAAADSGGRRSRGHQRDARPGGVRAARAGGSDRHGVLPWSVGAGVEYRRTRIRVRRDAVGHGLSRWSYLADLVAAVETRDGDSAFRILEHVCRTSRSTVRGIPDPRSA